MLVAPASEGRKLGSLGARAPELQHSCLLLTVGRIVDSCCLDEQAHLVLQWPPQEVPGDLNRDLRALFLPSLRLLGTLRMSLLA